MKHYRHIIVLLLFFCLQSCSKEQKTDEGKVVAVKSQTFANTLFYSGSIQPLKTVVVPSPADGVIVEMPFQYGQEIKAGQLLFMISSTKFLADYKVALMQYVKAKSDFNNSKSQLAEADFLHKNQLISDDDFKTKKTTFYGNQLTLLQAQDILENLLKQLDIKDLNLYQLTIADIDKITQAMHLKMNSENLQVLSPASGMILSAGKNEEENKKIVKGDVIKQGDVLAVIGDMSGISVRIKVNELTINQLNVGQKVKVTGIAFPEYTLNGEIKRVDRQGETTTTGLPTFSVEVIVPTLSVKQQNIIHVGMSAKVEINIEEEPHIMVPIVAVSEKDGKSFVKVFHKKTDTSQEIEVKTGKTTIDSVAILAGLKTGDSIVIPN